MRHIKIELLSWISFNILHSTLIASWKCFYNSILVVLSSELAYVSIVSNFVGQRTVKPREPFTQLNMETRFESKSTTNEKLSQTNGQSLYLDIRGRS